MRSPVTHFIFMFILGVLSVLGYVFWYSIVMDERAKVVSLQDQIDLVHNTADRITLARTILSGTENDEVKMRSYFVPEANVASFINDLESRTSAQKATLSVSSVSTGGTSAHLTLKLDLIIKGTFDAVMHTIGAIEYAPYAISIPTVSVQQDDKGVWLANLKVIVGSIIEKTTTS